DVPILARRRRQNLRRGNVVPFTLEAGAAHLAEEQVAQDDEGPGAHVGAGLEALARRPRLEQRFLDEVVGEVAAARQRPAEGAQVGNDRRELLLELRILERDRSVGVLLQ